MLVQPGKVVTAAYWQEQTQKLGIDDQTTPSQDERRTYKENGEYTLTFWNGNAWVKANRDADLLDGQEGSYYRNASNLNAGTVPLDRIPNVLTGKDADTLDSEHATDLHNAANLTGTVSRDRLGDIWRDTTSNQTTSPFIQSGKNTITAGSGTQSVTFDLAFTETPRISFASNYYNPSLASISTTGFSVLKHSTTTFDVNWIAIGRKS